MDRPFSLLYRCLLGIGLAIAVVAALPLIVAGGLLLYLRTILVLLFLLANALWKHGILAGASALKNVAASFRPARASASQKLAAKQR